MAEASMFWTTGSTGDGASPYTQAQIFAWLLRTFVNAPATEGILKGYANELAPSGTASPVAIATGAAMVNGIPYENTAAVNVAVPMPVIGKTGHRIVLRASWAAQTVRVVLLSSSDGVAAIPAATQTPGTTYDLTLATLTITTGGVITLTDARGYLHPNIKVATQNVDDDAIDDTKVGNRVPQLYRRQGGSATNWSTPGTSDYTPGAVRMQCGSTTVTINAGSYSKTQSVNLPVAFSNPPLVLASFTGLLAEEAHITAEGDVSTLTLQVQRTQTTGAMSFTVAWLAIGPE